MCGSGTLLCEALMAYCCIPAGYLRKRFGFEALPDFDPEIWQTVKQEVDAQIRPLPEGLIAGSDISDKALDAARKSTGLKLTAPLKKAVLSALSERDDEAAL